MNATPCPKVAFLAAIASEWPLEAAVETFLRDRMHIVDYDRNEIILPVSDANDRLYFVHRGLIRSYYHIDHENGEEERPTHLFAAEGQLLALPTGTLRQRPGRKGIESLEKSTVVYLDCQNLEALYAAFPATVFLRAAVAERYLPFYSERMEVLQIFSAREKYEWFLAFHRELRNRVNDYHVASYLGLAAGTVRRLRKEQR